MQKWIVALVTGALMAVPAAAADDVGKYIVLSASADSWNVWNAGAKVFDDATVQGGKAVRVTAKKGAHSWEAKASITIPPVAKGDVILAAYYARVETPPAGSATAMIESAGFGLNKAPYTGFGGEAAAPTGKWAIYYASGVADADHAKGTVDFGVQVAGADQVIDFGPLFLLNFGPNYDLAKLPHNRLAAAVPAAAPAATNTGAESIYAADLAKLRAKLPVKGTLISDPSQLYTSGPDVTSQTIAAPELAGGKATRTVTAKAGTNSWDDGVSGAITGAIKKGDVVFVAVQVRASEPPAGAQAGLVSELGVKLSQTPWTAIATASATVPKGQWTWVYASGIAGTDYAPGGVGFGMQLGCCKQTLDIGPVFVLDLGSGVDTNALPNNFGK